MAALNDTERCLCHGRYYNLSISEIDLESVVCIITSVQLNNKKLFCDTRQRQEIYLCPQHPYQLWTHQIQWVSRTLYVAVKRPDLETHHLTQYGVEV